MSGPILEVDRVAKHFRGKEGRWLKAVEDVSLTLAPGETLGIVGESGSGKSTLGRLMLGLHAPTAGLVRFEGVDLAGLSAAARRRLRRHMQPIFQDPYASLDPRFTVGASIAEPLVIHGLGDGAQRRRRVAELLEIVGLEPDAAGRYPHEFSGGQRQRIGIARAIAPEPKLIVADEPVSALDVSIQSQILNLLIELKARLGLSYVFISHDLAVVEHISDRVAVMYLGRIVEMAETAALYRRAAHPYTQALVSAILEPDPERRRERIILPGDAPNPEAPPPGCPFHTRCRQVMPHCRTVVPARVDLGTPTAPHPVDCHLYGESKIPAQP
jgi:oligopeptide/dipeptide ABC transporter ATP-binding protein